MNIKIRNATVNDAVDILKIYEHYVLNTAVSFEYEVPSLKDFQKRISETLKKFPYIVAVDDDGKILGYSYAGAFKSRAAYDWSVELTIYLDKNSKRQGIGRKLYSYIENLLREMGITNLYACIAYPDSEDEFLTFDSANFHEHLGFKTVGKFNKCARKFQKWYNMIYMEKIISKHN